ncbi:MAG: hypothetical protein Q7T60_17025 [Sphingopyxis sp.]|nr:hypothetical protein [Sphingopyxis sp.]
MSESQTHTSTAREQKRLRDEQALIEAVETELDLGGVCCMDELIKRAQARVKRRRMQ